MRVIGELRYETTVDTDKNESIDAADRAGDGGSVVAVESCEGVSPLAGLEGAIAPVGRDSAAFVGISSSV